MREVGSTRPDAESRLSMILDAMPDGILTIDRDATVTAANRAICRLLGFAPDELVDRPFSRLVHELGIAQQLADRVAANDAIFAEEIQIVRGDGEPAWLSISATTYQPSSPDAFEVGPETFVFVRDVTERHQARVSLERKCEELKTHVDHVAHDLRSPLASILGFTRLLREDPEALTTNQRSRFLARIETAGRSMEQLLKDLLELSRVGGVRPHRVEVNPGPVLEQLAAELKLRLDEAGIELTLPAAPPTILCDRTRLYQIFSNLIGNAIDHMGPVDDARIDIDIDETEDGLQIVVEDNGCGIASEDRRRIFEIFQTARADPGGKTNGGFGLAIVKKIVESHAGRVWVESAPEGGCRFVVQLPAA